MYREQLPFRDNVYRISYEDGRAPEYFSTYNSEITGWTENVPPEIQCYGSYFNVYLQQKLSSRGMIFISEGPNE